MNKPLIDESTRFALILYYPPHYSAEWSTEVIELPNDMSIGAIREIVNREANELGFRWEFTTLKKEGDVK